MRYVFSVFCRFHRTIATQWFMAWQASKHFGISNLYPFQLRLVSTTVSGRDSLVIQPCNQEREVPVLSAGGIAAKACVCLCSNLSTHVPYTVACTPPCSLTKNISKCTVAYHTQVFSTGLKVHRVIESPPLKVFGKWLTR